jgi:hypothetical protein
MIATRAMIYLGASPSLRKMNPLIMTNPVITGTIMATTIWPTVVVNHSRIDRKVNLDWVASAMCYSFFKGFISGREQDYSIN